MCVSKHLILLQRNKIQFAWIRNKYYSFVFNKHLSRKDVSNKYFYLLINLRSSSLYRLGCERQNATLNETFMILKFWCCYSSCFHDIIVTKYPLKNEFNFKEKWKNSYKWRIAN
ncbi:unnamed protein product [Larinioides sclopetarius]|uniref:Uncharacterized protein n=1 Tax=Larinioides sclopetarius TaxID=280406 RepID=A0AAV2C1L4_9ARAC